MDEQVVKNKPFYLQLSHYATHLGMESKKETIAKIKGRTRGERHTNVMYAGMAEDLDTGVGLILDEIYKLGIEDNTYIIYVADNGTYPTNNPGNINGPLHGWKATVWQGAIKVPFIIAGPGIKHAYCDTSVITYDLFPTICDWLGINDLPKGVEGGSLVNALHSPNSDNAVKRPNDFLVFHFPHYQLQKGGQPSSAIIKGNYKLIKFYEDNTFYLFDLKKDISEIVNLAQKKPEVVKELNTDLQNYLDAINAQLPIQNVDYNLNNDPGLKFRNVKERLLKEPYFILE
jgi:arylsulfatase A-like enzyme